MHAVYTSKPKTAMSDVSNRIHYKKRITLEYILRLHACVDPFAYFILFICTSRLYYFYKVQDGEQIQ